MLRIYTQPTYSAEKNYAFFVLLGELLGISYEVMPDPAAEHYRIVLPDGAALIVEDHFFGKLADGEYLLKENIPDRALALPHPFESAEIITGIYGRTHWAAADRTMTCGIDLFASAFFMLSRWEEYVLPDRDEHGRFPAERSLAFRAGFLDRPVVNEYAALLYQILLRLGWNQPGKNATFNIHLSHDVDHPLLWWSAAARLKTLAGSVTRFNPGEFRYWLTRYFFNKKDPYDVFDEWMDLSEKNGHVSHFNFLGVRSPDSNCWYPLDHPFVQNLIKKIAERGHVVGFHPSYESFGHPDLFEQERRSLQQLSPQGVRTGRQHYLRFAAPFTWQDWEDAGMDWDSTLGYAEAEGFRCGICCEFPVFNIMTRKMLRLREKPLLAMDVSLAHYRHYTPEMAFDKLMQLRKQVEKHGGEFVLLWHNSSWNTYFWAPWQEVYRSFISS